MKISAKLIKRRKAIAYIFGGIALMLVGAVGLAIPFFTYTTAQDWSLLDEQVQAVVEAAERGSPTPTPDTQHREVADRLLIPKIKVDMPLYGGTDENVLFKGGWMFPGTAAPGGEGNAVVFGHRFRYLPPISNTFFHLDELAQGDTFVARYGGQDLVYRVIGTSVVEPTDFSVLQQPEGKKWMTLITCAPAFSTKYRLVVIGELVE